MDTSDRDVDATLPHMSYTVYAEALLALRFAQGHANDQLGSVQRDVLTGTWLERRALMLALSDFLRERPLRTSQEFAGVLAVR